jgi:hypothetical protein
LCIWGAHAPRVLFATPSPRTQEQQG